MSSHPPDPSSGPIVFKKIKGILGIQPKPAGENSYGEHLRGGADETWPDALNRFESFCLSLHAFYDEEGETYELYFDEYFQDGTLFEWSGAVSDEDLLSAETQHAFAMPEELKALFRKRFAIYDVIADRGRWGDRRILEIYGRSTSTSYPCLHAFCPAIAWNFGEYFAREELTEEQIAHLSANYFCFGRWSDDDHYCTYLLVDRHGNYGRFRFHTEDYPGTLQRLEPLLNGQPFDMTLDALMVWAINNSMEYLLERNDLPSPHGKEA